MHQVLLKSFLILFFCFSLKTCLCQYNGTPQPNVLTFIKQHAVNLWIHLSTKANFSECVKIATYLPSYVEQVSSNSTSNEDVIEAGVGFGDNLWSMVANSSLRFPYYYRRGAFGDMPDTGGDIFLHAKASTIGKLYGLAKLFISKFPKKSVRCFKDTYSFTFENSRDLSLFIDGTANAVDMDERKEIALLPSTGGSFCITQIWVHNFERIDMYDNTTLETFVGRTREDSQELYNKSECSHVARIVGTTEYDAQNTVQIVRQAQPYGTLSGKAGLFFIAFAANVSNIDIMLDRMVGKTADGINDCLMKFTQCVESNYWYFPSQEELRQLQSSL